MVEDVCQPVQRFLLQQYENHVHKIELFRGTKTRWSCCGILADVLKDSSHVYRKETVRLGGR